MSTNVELEVLSPFDYAFEHADLSFLTANEPPAPEEPPVDEAFSRTDLGYFVNEAGRHKLLTAEEERRLGYAMWVARRRLLRLLRQSRTKRKLSLDVTVPRRIVTASTRRRLARVEALARQQPQAELDATVKELDALRHELVERNLRLVVWVAKSFRGRGFDFIDLIQEGNLGLMRAADRFDPGVGARFSTFATHWIQQGIRRALAEKARTIRIPVNRIAEVRQMVLARARLAERLGRHAETADIAREVGLPEHKVKELLPALAPMESIEAPIADTDRCLADTLEDHTHPSPFDEAFGEETKRAIRAGLAELPDRQRLILSMRHGIGYPKACTLEEIGEALGLSRERIRQVEQVANRSVRAWIEKHRRELATPV